MAWVRLDDGYPEHPKVDRVGPLAAWLNVCAWAYCARNLTDGFVPDGRVDQLAAVQKPRHLVELLLEGKLWERVPGGFLVHDFLDYNPSREQVLKERAAAAKRVNDWRNTKRTNGVGNAVTPSVTNTASYGVTNGVRTDAQYPARTRPLSHPGPESPPVAIATSPPGERRRVTVADDAFQQEL